MRVPERLEPLLDGGVIEEVIRPLMSGKEAEVYLVHSGGELRVAKVYKNAQHRSFQHRTDYTEGRRTRSSRGQRAMAKGSRHGRAQTEMAWRSAEVDAIGRLRSAGVRVPEPHAFVEGVLVMELVRGIDGGPAPRMVDVDFSREEANDLFQLLLREVVKMLCAGIIHADLSDFNILMSADGPVIIDLPQAVDPASNQSAKKLFVRDVNNLTSFLGRFAPALRSTQYGLEIWDLYARNELDPDTELTGKFITKKSKVVVSSLLEDILAVEQEARERREALGLPAPRPARKPVVYEEAPAPKPRPQPSAAAAPAEGEASKKKKRRRRRRGRGGAGQGSNGNGNAATPKAPKGPVVQTRGSAKGAPSSGDSDAPKPKRRRRRRRRRGPRRDGGGDSAPTHA